MPLPVCPGSAYRRAYVFLVAALATGSVALSAPAVPGSDLAAQEVEAARTASDEASPNYRLAGRFAPYKIRDLIYSTEVEPNWIEGTESFWYEWETSDGSFYYIVDAAQGTRRPVFDRDVLAAELTRIMLDPYDGQHLPIRSIRFIDANTLHFEVESSQDDESGEMEELNEQQQEEEGRRMRPKKQVYYFEYTISTQTLRRLDPFEEPDNHPDWASVSPDGQTVVFARDHNLFMMTADEYAKVLDARRGESGEKADSLDQLVETEETQLTTEGIADYSYAQSERGPTDKEREKTEHHRKPANLTWAKDSKRFSVQRTDQREVGDLWVIHSTDEDRPELETYKYAMAGEEHVFQRHLEIFDLSTMQIVDVDLGDWKDPRIRTFNDRQFRYPDSTEPERELWLSDTSDELFFMVMSRDQHRVDVRVADAATGASRVLLEERLNTYIEVETPERLANGDLLWWSERDGWAHLYRYGADGTLKNQLTRGPFSVRAIEHVDEGSGVVYFRANAREPGEDPYYQHLYRVGLDGSGLRLLNPGDDDHRVSVSPSGRFFVDNYSRTNTTPAAALLNTQGAQVTALEEADFSQLLAAGYEFPEPYSVKSADGVTDIYGNIYRPFDFDESKTYPIIAYVYPGPQTEAVSKFFNTNATETALAQFGFIVITVGNRGGNPDRSKWYHNYGYGNLRDYGLADKKAAIEQLADRYDYVDIDRVGIYGHSGGGFMSTAAMLVYPDFFKVAVSSSGNHTNQIYNDNWSEKHHGIKEVVNDEGEVTFEYEIDDNTQLAANLKGKLLLTTSDEDNNVHPANTIRMAEALIKANKRFDFFLFPGQRHGYGDMGDYWFWKRAEYFVEHLLGDERRQADYVELQNDEPRRNPRRRERANGNRGRR